MGRLHAPVGWLRNSRLRPSRRPFAYRGATVPDFPFGHLEVVYEDERLIAVAKPAGVAVAAGGRVAPEETLQARVAEHIGGKAYIVHRLDRETSGVMAFAKTAESHRQLSLQFERREVTKRYLALVDGHVDGREGEIAAPLCEFGSGRVGVDPSGREARTVWKLREQLGDADLLDVTPVTGRRHQIRVHLYSIGHPVIGDTRYGELRPVGGAPRLMLHALELGFADGLNFRADPPPEFLEIVERAR
jgi:tRNA pseudouridine32 synthase/23S rRNA pseudouridine746 synthase